MTEEVELLQALIRHGCVNDGRQVVGEEPNADALHAVLDGCGADIEVVDAEPTRRNLVARLPGTDPAAPALLLLAHTDVVPVTRTRWTRDPFGGELVDGFVWGRGALDMLGYAATMALAVRDHARSGRRLRGDVILAAVADEEMLSRLGTRWLLDHRPELIRADWVVTEGGGSVVPGPEGDQVAASVSDRGVWLLEITVQGTPRHAALNHGREDALGLAAEVCMRLTDARADVIISDPWRWFVEEGWNERARDALTDPTRVDAVVSRLPETAARLVRAATRMTLAVTSITSNGTWNTVPDQARVEVQVRTVPGQTRADVISFIRSALADMPADVILDVRAGGPATTTAPHSDLWRIVETATQEQLPRARLQPTVNAGATDARFFRELGATAYGVGLLSRDFPMGEVSTMMHGDDERIDVTTLAMMRDLWGSILALHTEVEGQ
ncbi:MAG TPA: peptidase M20 family protein [Actinobacteria bacterium]|nr:peptidase M20 family protein [Actinomycetota bacterium]